LEIYEGALLDQEEIMKGEFSKSLAQCFKMTYLDLGSCKHLGDDFFASLTSGEASVEGNVFKPGFKHLLTVKVNFLDKIMDGSVNKLLQVSPKVEHLELTGCINLTDYFLENMFKSFLNLKFVDLNHIPAMANMPLLE